MKKFEYTTLSIENNVRNDTGIYYHTDIAFACDEANDMGKDGWEMVSIYEGTAWFKREIQNVGQ